MAQTRQGPTFWTPPEELLAPPSRTGCFPCGTETPFWSDANPSAWGEGPELALLPTTQQEQGT
ncbi:MAG TPA: hypothetical protein PK777_16480, partial [Thermoguttaceae bacterium]|nr:hypothetical protein [Thermoguttaceae bacterium]